MVDRDPSRKRAHLEEATTTHRRRTAHNQDSRGLGGLPAGLHSQDDRAGVEEVGVGVWRESGGVEREVEGGAALPAEDWRVQPVPAVLPLIADHRLLAADEEDAGRISELSNKDIAIDQPASPL